MILITVQGHRNFTVQDETAIAPMITTPNTKTNTTGKTPQVLP